MLRLNLSLDIVQKFSSYFQISEFQRSFKNTNRMNNYHLRNDNIYVSLFLQGKHFDAEIPGCKK